MFKLLNNGEFQIDIDDFHIKDYLDNDLIAILEEFNFSLQSKKPIVLCFETTDSEYYIIPNLTETYIIDTNNENIQVVPIGLFELGNSFLNDIKIQRDNILDYYKDISGQDVKDIDYTLHLNTVSLELLLNQSDFSYNTLNLNRRTLESLNHALYLHTIDCVYDKLENIEMFRLFTNEKTYLISVIHKKSYTKHELEVINENIVNIAISIYNTIKNQIKLTRTQQLMNDLKTNLIEYNIILDKGD